MWRGAGMSCCRMAPGAPCYRAGLSPVSSWRTRQEEARRRLSARSTKRLLAVVSRAGGGVLVGSCDGRFVVGLWVTATGCRY